MGGILLASLYPYMKRHTHLPQVFLGMAFGWAVPMVFAAQLGSVPIIAWLVFIATVIWAVIYDTMYAMVDRDDDLKIGVKSTAVLFGELDKVFIGLFQLLFLLR
jgi:4-hydroxybenzoate polyprenyltransferase and related prenyltransferases